MANHDPPPPAPRPGGPLALSVRQPWAALLVAGLKTVEVRTWPTRRRGPLLIHAGRLADDRPDGWALVPPEWVALARLRGGVIGVADLADCVRYGTPGAFEAAVGEHRNPPDWFRPEGLWGFVFRNPRPVAYHACPGQTFFFGVDSIPPDHLGG